MVTLSIAPHDELNTSRGTGSTFNDETSDCSSKSRMALGMKRTSTLVVTKDFEQLPFLFRTLHFYVVRVHFRCASLSSIGCGLLNLEDAFGAPLFRVCYTSSAATLDWSSLDAYRYVVCGCILPQGRRRGRLCLYLGSARAGFRSLNEGQAIEFELVSNRGKTSRENLRVRR